MLCVLVNHRRIDDTRTHSSKLTSATGLTWSGLGLDLDTATGQAVFSYDIDENIQMPLLLTCGELVSTCVKIQN